MLEAVHATGQKFGAAHIVDVLRGTRNDKTARFGHESLPVFGAGAERSQGEWQGIIRQMVAAGLLDIDIAGYGGLHATATAEAVARGEAPFRYRPDRLRQEPKAKRGYTGTAGGANPTAAKAAATLDADAAALLQRLKALRLTLAKERGVPAYVIFSDRTLIDMAARRPRTRDAFAEVFGVGEAKLRDFAAVFLAEIGEDAATG